MVIVFYHLVNRDVPANRGEVTRNLSHPDEPSPERASTPEPSA
jgi:hypothetical protein